MSADFPTGNFIVHSHSAVQLQLYFLYSNYAADGENHSLRIVRAHYVTTIGRKAGGGNPSISYPDVCIRNYRAAACHVDPFYSHIKMRQQLAPMSNLVKPLTVMFAVGKSVDI